MLAGHHHPYLLLVDIPRFQSLEGWEVYLFRVLQRWSSGYQLDPTSLNLHEIVKTELKDSIPTASAAAANRHDLGDIGYPCLSVQVSRH